MGTFGVRVALVGMVVSALAGGGLAMAGGDKPTGAAAEAKKVYDDQMKRLGTVMDDGAGFGASAYIVADTHMSAGPMKAEEMPGVFDHSSGGAGPVKTTKLKIFPSADGKSAWIAATLRVMEYNPGDGPGFWVDYRVSELVAEKDGKWQIVAAYWSVPIKDKDANAAAQKHPADPTTVTEGADEAVGVEVAGLVGGALRGRTFAELVDERADLLVIGSAPKEEVVGGKKWKKAWAAWSDKISLVGGVHAGVTPSGTTAWAVATFTLRKTPKKGAAYDIPFRAFLVLDKTAAGWRVMHAHVGIAR